MISDDLSELISHELSHRTAADLAREFNREKKFVYYLENGSSFRCDPDFVCGLNGLGYELRLVKRDQTASCT